MRIRCKCFVIFALLVMSASGAAPRNTDFTSLKRDLDALGGRITRLQDLTEVEIVQTLMGTTSTKRSGARSPICLPTTRRLRSAEKASSSVNRGIRIHEYWAWARLARARVCSSTTNNFSAYPRSMMMASRPRCDVPRSS